MPDILFAILALAVLAVLVLLIARLAAPDLEIQVNYTITPRNHRALCEFLKFIDGLGLNIDGTDMGRVAFVRCLPNGCVAEVVMDDALIKQLEQQPLSPSSEIHVHVLQHNDATKLGPQLQTLLRERAKMALAPGQEERPSDRITIVALSLPRRSCRTSRAP